MSSDWNTIRPGSPPTPGEGTFIQIRPTHETNGRQHYKLIIQNDQTGYAIVCHDCIIVTDGSNALIFLPSGGLIRTELPLAVLDGEWLSMSQTTLAHRNSLFRWLVFFGGLRHTREDFDKVYVYFPEMKN